MLRVQVVTEAVVAVLGDLGALTVLDGRVVTFEDVDNRGFELHGSRPALAGDV